MSALVSFPWSRRTVALIGALLAAIGFTALGGWLGSVEPLIQLHPQFAPMHYNAALGFVIWGIGLAAILQPALRIGLAAAVLLFGIGLISFLETSGVLHLGFEHWWMAAPPGLRGYAIGLTPTSSLCFCLAGGALALLSLRDTRFANPLCIALFGAVLLLINVLAAFGFPLRFWWPGAATAAAPQLAVQEFVGFVAGGLAVIVVVFRCELASASPRPWLHLFVGLSGATVTLLLWQNLDVQESQRLGRLVEFEAVHVQRQLTETLMSRFETLVQEAANWRLRGRPRPDRLAEDVDHFVARQPGCVGMALVQSNRPPEWLGSPDRFRMPRTEFLASSDLVRQFLTVAAAKSAPSAFYDRRDWRGRGGALLVYAPIEHDAPVRTGLIAVLQMRDYLDTLVNFNVAQGFAVEVRDGAEVVYGRFTHDAAYRPTWERILPAATLGLDWHIRVWPTHEVMAKEALALSRLTLVVGLLMSSLLGLAVRLAQTARRRSALLEHEIVERAQAESLLRQSEAKYRSLIDNLENGVFLLDRDLRYRAANNHFCREAGLSEAELLGRCDLELLPAEQGARRRAEASAVLRDGQKLEVEEEVCVAGQSRWIHRLLTPVKDDQEQIAGVLGICWDITERRDLEANLRQGQKMEAIGQLAGGVAHDFNNLLTAILGNLELALHHAPVAEHAGDLLRSAEKAGRRAAELTGQLLSFSRQGQLNRQAVDVNALMDEVVALLGRTIDPRIRLQLCKCAQIPQILGDPGQVNQVLMNLCLNARDAIAGSGTIVLESAIVEFDEFASTRHADAKPGAFVRVRVSDNGCGMSAEIRARMFEPFFTTKGVGKGTGLGLATVFGIVKQHQGWIDCHSEVGRGTRFDVYLPFTPAAPPVVQKPASAMEISLPAVETILVVDDEPLIRKMALTVLQQRGYHVLEAGDGVQAVSTYGREKDRIDLVILDLTMPRMSGQEAFRQLRQLDPEVPVVFASGYTAEHITEEEQGMILGFVKKPYRPKELVQSVQEALIKRRGAEAALSPALN